MEKWTFTFSRRHIHTDTVPVLLHFPSAPHKLMCYSAFSSMQKPTQCTIMNINTIKEHNLLDMVRIWYDKRITDQLQYNTAVSVWGNLVHPMKLWEWDNDSTTIQMVYRRTESCKPIPTYILTNISDMNAGFVGSSASCPHHGKVNTG